jgi:hypothetical protein
VLKREEDGSMKILHITSIAAALFLVACGDDIESKARSYMEYKANGIGGIIKRFKMTPAQRRSMLGVDIISVEHTTEILLPNGLNAHCVDILESRNSDKRTNIETFKAANDCRQLDVVKPGGVIAIKSPIIFEKTSVGWRSPDGRIY